MGSEVSQPVKEERLKWAMDHSLQIDPQLRRDQIPSLKHFGDRLHMFQRPVKYMGIAYQHFYITDHTWTIEFGGGDLRTASDLRTATVLVHTNPKPVDAVVVQEKMKTPAIIKRMGEVCGARGYSLALRNSEHLARYIFTGRWTSQQMLKGADLAVLFMRHMMARQVGMVNTPPEELMEQDEAPEPLYPGVPAYIKNFWRSDGLALSDEKAYNILVVGPSGCGKSHLINMMFNATICKSNGSAASVTKTIDLISGEAIVLGEKRKVNVIDTVGFGDTHLIPSQVLSLIKEQVKLNFVYLDRVVVMCSGRVDRAHADCAKQIMKWLKYDEEDYKLNFTFIYGKADMLPEDAREESLAIMCNLLKTGDALGSLRIKAEFLPSAVHAQTPPTQGVIKACDTKIHCGLNPSAAFADVQDEFHRVLDVVFLPSMKPWSIALGDFSIDAQRRIPVPVEESWCSIL